MRRVFKKAVGIPRLSLLFSVTCIVLLARIAGAQGNYEIQVYGSDTVAPQSTMMLPFLWFGSDVGYA